MRHSVVPIVLLAVTGAAVLHAQITSNPIPARIEMGSRAVEIREIARLPDTRNKLPPGEDVKPAGWARISVVRDAPDGRRFAVDARGVVYVLASGNRPSVYLDASALLPYATYGRLASGLNGFTVHPEFASNGLFYTTHTERADGNPRMPHFIPPGYTARDVTWHNVLTEWKADSPSGATFKGTRRELLRLAHVTTNQSHPLSSVEFNPTAKPGSPDYGLLYTSGSDFGFSNGGGPNANNPTQTQRLDSVITAILRINPRSPVTGGVKGLGDYTVPMDNRFAADGDPATLGEIYAYGFRNAHRLSWDRADGTMFASDIGMNQIEEINIVRNGGNYGWMAREGTFENGMTRPGGALNQLFELPAAVLDGKERDSYIYPVAMYDHDEGVAVSGGFAYRGTIEALRGMFVFGDVARGRIFAASLDALKRADDGVPRTVAPIEEIQLYVRDSSGARRNVTLQQLVDETMGMKLSRADLHLAQTADGEILVTSRQDGTIRMLVTDSTTATATR